LKKKHIETEFMNAIKNNDGNVMVNVATLANSPSPAHYMTGVDSATPGKPFVQNDMLEALRTDSQVPATG